MSTISHVAGTIRPGWIISASLVSRSSGTVITPRFGSIVQKGKFADCALALDRQLNNVDLPTFGRPTIPHFNAIFFKRLNEPIFPSIGYYFLFICKITQNIIKVKVKRDF
jgi:hypothetical protein